MKLDEAATTYLKIADADIKYLKLDEAAEKYLKIADADIKYLKIDDAARLYLKLETADERYAKIGDAVAGDGSVFTGFQAVPGAETKTVLNVPGYLRIDAHGSGGGEGVNFVLIALRPFNGDAQVTSGDGSVRLVEVKLDAGGTQTLSYEGAIGQVTLQLVNTEQDGKAQVLTATLNAGGAGAVSAQGLLGAASP